MSRSHVTFFHTPKSTLTPPRKRYYFTPKVTTPTMIILSFLFKCFIDKIQHSAVWGLEFPLCKHSGLLSCRPIVQKLSCRFTISLLVTVPGPVPLIHISRMSPEASQKSFTDSLGQHHHIQHPPHLYSTPRELKVRFSRDGHLS